MRRELLPLEPGNIVLLGDNFHPERLHGRRARVLDLTHNAAKLRLLKPSEDERAVFWFPRCYITAIEGGA